MKFQTKSKHFHSRKCIWKCGRRNGGHLVSASMCYNAPVLLIISHLRFLSTAPMACLDFNYGTQMWQWQSSWMISWGSMLKMVSKMDKMMTSSNRNIFRVTGHFCGESTRSVTQSVDVFFDLRPNIRLSKQWWGWWFETPLSPLWRHCNEESLTNAQHRWVRYH